MQWVALGIVISSIAALATAQAETAAFSTRFMLEWYGPQMATYEQPEPSPTDHPTKLLIVFKKIPHIPLVTALLSFKTDGELVNGAFYGFSQTLVAGVELTALNTTEMNMNGQRINFADYRHMEPEDSEALAHKYQNDNYTIYKAWLPNIREDKRPIPETCVPFRLVFTYGGAEFLTRKQYKVDGWETLNTHVTFLRCGPSVLKTLEPALSTAQGGSALTFGGSGFPIFAPPMSDGGLSILWPVEFPLHLQPIIKFTAATKVTVAEIDGYSTEVMYYQHQYSDVSTWTADSMTALTVPQLLNDTATLNISFQVSFNRQQWLPVPMEMTVFGDFFF